MGEQLAVSRSVLARLINGAYPDPEHFGPYGPYGPVMRRHGKPGPLPDPWLGAAAAGATIQYALDRQELAESIDVGGRVNESARTSIEQFVDDICGTPPRLLWPFPWPPPRWWDMDEIGPVDILAAGAQFQRIVETMPDSALATTFGAGADKLFDVGLQQLAA